MTEHTTPASKAQATEQERIALESAQPRTIEEIAALLEAMAHDQSDLALARRLRDWAAAVQQHGQEQLRAQAANVQSELYRTLEAHLTELRDAIDAIREVAARRLDSLEERIATLEQAPGRGNDRARP